VKSSLLFCVLSVVLLTAVASRAADDMGIERLALCQDSWLEWKDSNPARLKQFADAFRSNFRQQKDTDAFFVPKSSLSIAGLPVAQVFPESIGMAVGFSVVVNASFDQTRKAIETRLGKALKKCEVGDNMRTCGLEIAEKKTVLLMASDDPKSATTLFGCYYLYEK